MDAFFSALSAFGVWLGKTSLQASVLILLVLAAQWLLRRHLSPAWRYGLWLLVLIRLALPQTPESAFSVFNLAPPSSRFTGGNGTLNPSPAKGEEIKGFQALDRTERAMANPWPDSANAPSPAQAAAAEETSPDSQSSIRCLSARLVDWRAFADGEGGLASAEAERASGPAPSHRQFLGPQDSGRVPAAYGNAPSLARGSKRGRGFPRAHGLHPAVATFA